MEDKFYVNAERSCFFLCATSDYAAGAEVFRLSRCNIDTAARQAKDKKKPSEFTEDFSFMESIETRIQALDIPRENRMTRGPPTPIFVVLPRAWRYHGALP